MTSDKKRYLIPELTYHHDHPDVIFWTKFFFDVAQKKNVFANYQSALAQASNKTEAANTVAAAWEEFTRFVPKFICNAVIMMPQPEWQHHVIQIAYEELGGRLKKNIHSKLFGDAIEKAGLSTAGCNTENIEAALSGFSRALQAAPCQQGILGLLLSFEIIAEQNIEALCDGLSFDAGARACFDKSLFFNIHRADESEHIRHSIANFLRFCPTEDDRKRFRESFDAGIACWQTFWDQMARSICLGAIEGLAA